MVQNQITVSCPYVLPLLFDRPRHSRISPTYRAEFNVQFFDAITEFLMFIYYFIQYKKIHIRYMSDSLSSFFKLFSEFVLAISLTAIIGGE